MSETDRLLRLAAEATEARPEAIERLVAREAWPGRALRASAVEAADGATGRLVRRLERPRRSRRARWLLAPAVVASLLVLLWPVAPPPPLSGRLDAESLEERTITERVGLVFVGHGELSGTAEDVHIFWEVGTLDVEVRPDADVALRVETGEGQITVVGTRFSVNRSLLGTAVSVERGHVAVACGAEPPRALAQDQSALCQPVRAAGMLGRARALREQGATDQEVLDAVERGLILAKPGDAAIAELVALRLDVLVSAGRFAEAREAARAYLETGDPARAAEVQAILDSLGGGGAPPPIAAESPAG